MWIDDILLQRCAEPVAASIFVPETKLVVLGSSNAAEVEAHSAACTADGVPILRRMGGGGTVLLYPGCLVISLGTWVRDYYDNKKYFGHINDAVIATLKAVHPMFAGLNQTGLSDIAFQGRKVCGTSLFRSRHYLLYQASLLVELDLPAIDRYLKHPSKEPDYRAGRSHGSFLVGLKDLEPALEVQNLAAVFRDRFVVHVREMLAGLLIDPVENQMVHLRKRMDACENRTIKSAMFSQT